MHLFQRGQQFISYWRSLKSSLSALARSPCWNTVLNLSILIKHSLAEVFLRQDKVGCYSSFACVWDVIRSTNRKNSTLLVCHQGINELQPRKQRSLPIITQSTNTGSVVDFVSLCLSPDVLATTRKQNTALDSAYGQWTCLCFYFLPRQVMQPVTSEGLRTPSGF